MNFGQNLQAWFASQAQPIVLIGIAVIGIYLLFKREFTKLVPFAIIAVIAVVMVFNPAGFKDVLLALGNKIFGVK